MAKSVFGMGGLAAVLLTACVSSVQDHVPKDLRGCWVHHGGIATRTMRWFPAQGLSWRGDLNFYHAAESENSHQAFVIDGTAGEKMRFGWAICPQDDSMGHGPPCKALYFGHGPKITDDSEWMELRATKDHLTFDLINGGKRSTLFDGVRDGCD